MNAEGDAIRESGRAADRALWWWSIGIMLVGIGVACGAALVTAWISYGWPPNDLVSSTGKDSPSMVEPIKVGLAVAAGLGGAVALVVQFRKQRILERDDVGRREEAKARNDRYGAAVAQLGNVDAAVRMGGVYALANLADDWPEQRQQCVDVLCAYLRLPWEHHQDHLEALASKTVKKTNQKCEGEETTWAYRSTAGEKEVRKTILRVIGAHLKTDDKPGPWSTLELDLSGAKLPLLMWSGAYAGRLNCSGATFSETAWFKGAKFSETAWFSGSTFSRDAVFAGATFSRNAVFAGATFSDVPHFDEVTCEKSDVSAHLAEVVERAQAAVSARTTTAAATPEKNP